MLDFTKKTGKVIGVIIAYHGLGFDILDLPLDLISGPGEENESNGWCVWGLVNQDVVGLPESQFRLVDVRPIFVNVDEVAEVGIGIVSCF